MKSAADHAIIAISQKHIDRFNGYVDKKHVDECWEWKLTKQKSSGHGVFSIRSISCFAHRVAFFLHNGRIPQEGLIVLHDCENPGCCNPHHLLEGTVKQNGNYPGCVAKLKARVGPLTPMYGKRGKNSPRFGMKHTEETKSKLREKAIKRGGWHKGFKRSPESIERIRAARLNYLARTKRVFHGQKSLGGKIGVGGKSASRPRLSPDI